MSARLQVLEILPAPFEWIDIPAGRVTLLNTWDDHTYLKKNEPVVFEVPAYSIAKYPITNAQFAPFVEAGGYQQEKWWTEVGWTITETEKQTEPDYWHRESQNKADHPVVGVSWYEAIAFCNWLSAVTGDFILLPTEQQWQRAAQGDTEWVYPWGDDWDAERCSNHVNGKGWKTTAVTDYQGVGDSPFGVVDLVGNVYEWCLTAYNTGLQDLNGTELRVLRGGSSNSDEEITFRATSRQRADPIARVINGGFRIIRSIE